MKPPTKRLAALVLVAALALGACTDARPERSSEPSSSSEQEQTENTGEASTVDNRIDVALTKIGAAYTSVEGKWEGFKPNEHPVVLPFKDNDDQLQAVLAINHPKPDALGDTTSLKTDELPFDSAHLVENPTDIKALEALQGYEFHAELGGVDSFAMVAGGADEFFDPTTTDYTATLLHEMFHRYQDEAFSESLGAQDIEGYAYTAENLELALLEDRALTEALGASDDASRKIAAERFAALRLTRIGGDDRVVLDNNQEMFEGSARFIEHQLASDDEAYSYHEGNYDRELSTDFEDDIKEVFGFGRFYASGAAILRVAQLEGVTDLDTRTEAGENPAEILIDTLGVTEADAARLVAEAKASYDPSNKLPKEAAEAAKRAESEGPVFGEEESSIGDGLPEGDLPGDGEEITEEELACLEENGADLEEGAEISDELAKKCLP